LANAAALFFVLSKVKTMYTFSENTVTEFYGIQFYSIYDKSGIVAYSQKVFEIPAVKSGAG